ncbi:MAG: phytoene desaturase family protein [Candidatus Nanopelagicales bacterium]
MARVCVIGAGAGGLAVAARLGAKRHDVTLLEASDRVGGKLRTVRRDGFAFDAGPSLFTLPAVYRDLFLKTGPPLEQEVDLQECEPGFRYRFADGTVLDLPGSSMGRTVAALGRQLPDPAAAEWRSLMDRAADIWRLTRTDVLGTAIDGRRQLLTLARPRDLRTVAPWRSLHDMGSDLSDPRLRMVLDRYATYSGSQPTQAPGALVTIPFVETTFGLWHIGGGLGTLADALQRRCEKAGVTIRLGTRVAAIDHSHGTVTGVTTTTGEHLAADIVIPAGDSRLLPELLGTASSRRTDTESYSGFTIMAAVDGTTPDARHHTVWFPADYAGEFRDLAAGRPVADPAIYVCRPDDPAMAPDGAEAWCVLVNAPRHAPGAPDGHDWSDPLANEAYADRIFDILAARGTDIRDRVRWRMLQTPADLGAHDGTGDGAIYGTAAHGALSVLRRARNRGPLTGLYQVGGTAHPGGGLPLVGMGAEIVAEDIGRADRT